MATPMPVYPPNPAVRPAEDQGMGSWFLLESFKRHIELTRGKHPESATPYDRFLALATTVRDTLAPRWVATQRRYYEQRVKRAYYLSAEYLLGRALSNNLLNLGLLETAREALRDAGIDLDQL